MKERKSNRSPQEIKANYLFNKFLKYTTHGLNGSMAKKMALICVGEIIKEKMPLKRLNFWIEVQVELGKIKID